MENNYKNLNCAHCLSGYSPADFTRDAEANSHRK